MLRWPVSGLGSGVEMRILSGAAMILAWLFFAGRGGRGETMEREHAPQAEAPGGATAFLVSAVSDLEYSSDEAQVSARARLAERAQAALAGGLARPRFLARLGLALRGDSAPSRLAIAVGETSLNVREIEYSGTPFFRASATWTLRQDQVPALVHELQSHYAARALQALGALAAVAGLVGRILLLSISSQLARGRRKNRRSARPSTRLDLITLPG